MIAVDTNILVYAVDTNEPVKGPKAAQLLRDLDPERTVLLWQVVCEFGAAMLRKKPKSEINIAIPDILTAWLGMFPLRVPSAAVIPRRGDSLRCISSRTGTLFCSPRVSMLA